MATTKLKATSPKRRDSTTADRNRAEHATHPVEHYYDLLFNHFGPTHWWPGESPFEMAVGAILTQNTAWSNVELAIDNLKHGKLLSAQAIIDADMITLHAALRPSGYFRVKTKRLRSFCAYLIDTYEGSMIRLAKRPLPDLRQELLNVHGIGPETADDILLYACEHPVFVVDAYTRRILSRHGLVHADIAYEPLRQFFEHNLTPDVQLFKDYHGLIVWTGKNFCRSTPKCENCPLNSTLPKNQPLLT